MKLVASYISPGFPGLCQFKLNGGSKLNSVSKRQRPKMPDASSQLSSKLGHYLLYVALDTEDVLISYSSRVSEMPQSKPTEHFRKNSFEVAFKLQQTTI